MPLKIYRLIYLTIVIVLLVEIGLEYRAHQRGWNTILWGMADKLPNSGHVDRQVQFGPTTVFPFRSLIVPFEKIPNIRRLWISSSSYAQDNYLNPAQIFPNLLAKKLNASGFQVQILNAAHEGETIEGNIRILKEIGRQWKPDYVLLYQMNLDINELSQQSYSDHPIQTNAHGALDPKEPVKPKISWGEELGEKTTIYQLLKENFTARISQSRILAHDIGEEARNGFRKRIYHFIETSRAIGAIPILCTFAASYDAHHSEIPDGVKNFLMRYNIYLSFSGWFKAIDQFNDDIRQIGKEQNVLVIDLNHYLDGKNKFFRDFVHFTPEGHKIMSQIIADKLLENKTVLLKQQ